MSRPQPTPEDLMLEHPAGRRPVPYRITVALGDRSGPLVDRALGGKEPMVDRWEQGLLEPTPWQVRLLAEYTGYPVDWFYDPAPPFRGFACLRGRGAERGCVPLYTPEPLPAAADKETLF